MVNYLNNVRIDEWQSDNEFRVCYLGKGYECSGFFPKEIIMDGKLEIEILGLDKSRNLVVVRPVQGKFEETLNGKGVLVRLDDVVYEKVN